MRVQIRSCCCALHTFVRILSIIMILGYMFMGLISFIVYGVTTSGTSLAQNRTFVIAFVLMLVFCSLGIGVSVLVLLAIRMNKRMLMLPWLVFKMMVIIGLFVLGIYIALHFTLLSDREDSEEESFSPAYAIFCIFPWVFAIFLVFLWILVDQLFIQMKTIKKLGLKTMSASNLSQLRSNITYHNESLRSAKSVKSLRSVHSVPSFKKNPQLKPRRSKSNTGDRFPHVIQIPEPMGYHSQSLPRPRHKRNKPRNPQQDPRPRPDGRKPIKRAKSLEHMLDSASSSSLYSATTSHAPPHLWLNKTGKALKRRTSSVKSKNKQDLSVSDVPGAPSPLTTSSSASSSTVSPVPPPPPPTYCTIDRSRMTKRLERSPGIPTNTPNYMQVQTLPRKPIRSSIPAENMRRQKRSRSVDLLTPENKYHVDSDPISCEQAIEQEFRVANRAEFASTPYIGDCGIEELKRITSEHILEGRTPGTKSVTIHPDVTEFHYPDDTHSSVHDKVFDDDVDDLPLPPPPLEAWLPEPIYPAPSVERQDSKSWLAKLSPKTKPGYTKDQIIDLYCQVGDVQL